MSTGLLFVTAPEADHKVINRLLLHLKDWEYDSGDRFRLVTSKSPDHLAQASPGAQKGDAETGSTEPAARATSAPVEPGLANEWASASLEDVENFCIALEKSGGAVKTLNSHLFVVLDTEGLQDQTCVLAERVINWEADPIEYLEEFNKARTPWYETYLAWCNLDISNINWDEMMDEEVAGKKGRWWVHHDEDSGEYLSDEKMEQRDAEIEKLRGEGKA